MEDEDKMKKNLYKIVATILISVILTACNTMPNSKNTIPLQIEKTDTIGENKKNNVISYGRDDEVQFLAVDGKEYYVLGGNKINEMTANEIKASSINTSRVKVNESTLNGKKGIILTYFDIKIFIQEKQTIGITTVGIYEPQKSDWTFGEDMDRSSKSIKIKLPRGIAGPITINTTSISMTYN